MDMRVILVKIFAIIGIICMCGCSGGSSSADPDDKPGKDDDGGGQGTDTEVPEGKVRLYLSESSNSLRTNLGLTRSWSGSKILVGGTTYNISKSSDGKWYSDVDESSSGTYNAVLVTTETEGKWYESSAYKDVRLPYSQFWKTTAESLKSYPMYASYSKSAGNNSLVFKDGFAVLDVSLTGSARIASVRLSSKSGEKLAGYATYFPSKAEFTFDEGSSFVALNCTNNDAYVLLNESSATHFYLLVAPGTYSNDLVLSIADSDHKSMKKEFASITLEAGEAHTESIKYSPEDDLIFEEDFDNFVWGGDIMGGKNAYGYAPDGANITYSNGTDRDGYAESYTKVAYNNPGTPFIQSNTWDDVSGKTVGTSHQMSDSYITSRNLEDYIYLFRCQEMPGYLACGTGNNGRGIFETPALTNIEELSSIKVSCDFCYQAGSNDLMQFAIIDGGMIESASIDGTPMQLTSENSSFIGVMGECRLEKKYVTVPNDESAVKEWHNLEVVVSNASSGTKLIFEGATSTSGVHGFYLDNVKVTSLGKKAKSSSTLRVLYWNIQYGMWADQPNNYANFVSFIKKYDPDVCVWCESASVLKDRAHVAEDASKRFLPDGWSSLAARYGHSYFSVGGKRDNFPQTITSKYPIETIVKITDTDVSGKPISHGAAVQAVDFNGHNIYFVTLHLWPQQYGFGVSSADQEASAAAHDGDYYREFEIKYLCSNTVNNTEYSSQTNWVMLGDFNSRSRYDNWYLQYPENDTRLLVHDHITSSTDLVDIIHDKYPSYMVSTTGGTARIDYVYASPSMSERVTNAVVITTDWSAPHVSPYASDLYEPSDHRPILVDFTF